MSGQSAGKDISVGDPTAFANEMVKLVNTKEYRSVIAREGEGLGRT